MSHQPPRIAKARARTGTRSETTMTSTKEGLVMETTDALLVQRSLKEIVREHL